MVAYLLRCGVRPDQPRPSIETLLHAFVPAAHVDHTHPDAVIALTSTPNGRQLAADAFGDEAVWLDYQRPGFDMSRRIAILLREHPEARAVLLERHGLVTWGDSGEESYEATIEFVSRAARAIDTAARGRFGLGGQQVAELGERSARSSFRSPSPRSAAPFWPTPSGSSRGRSEPRGDRVRVIGSSARGQPDRRALPRPFDQHEASPARRRLRSGEGRRAGAAAAFRRGVEEFSDWYRALLRAQPRRRDAAVPDRSRGAARGAHPGCRHRHDRLGRGSGARLARSLSPRDRRRRRRRCPGRVPFAQRSRGVRDRVLAARALQARAGTAGGRARRPHRADHRRGERDRPRRCACAGGTRGSRRRSRI